jgi:transcriptional regulator with XRE-family HTH domain
MPLLDGHGDGHAAAVDGTSTTPQIVASGVGARLRDARRALGVNQQFVADALRVSRRAVSEWETGNREPFSKLPELAALYDVSTSFLLYGVEPTNVELTQVHEHMHLVLENQGEIESTLSSLRSDLASLAELTSTLFAEWRRLVETGHLPAPEPPEDDRASARARDENET